MWVKDAKHAGDTSQPYAKISLPAGSLDGEDVKAACFPSLEPLKRNAYRLYFVDSIMKPSAEEECAAIAGEPFDEEGVIDSFHNRKRFLVAAVGEA